MPYSRMPLRSIPLRSVGTLLAAITLIGTPILTPMATAASREPPPWCSQTDTTDSYDNILLLGPKTLPNHDEDNPVGQELDNYKRTGNDTDDTFLQKYTKDGKYVYPADDPNKDKDHLDDLGFDTNAWRGVEMLEQGSRLDRYGSEHGQYLAPYATPFTERSIPPTNLKTHPNPPGHPCSYYSYTVSKPFLVRAGLTAPYFDQPGEGTQYYLDCTLLWPTPSSQESCLNKDETNPDKYNTNNLSVGYLVKYGYLTPLPQQ